MKKVRIADMNIEIDYMDKPFFNHRLRKYGNENFVKADMVLKTCCLNEINKPKGEVIKQISDATIVHIGDNRYCRYISSDKNGGILSAIYYNDANSEVEIHLSEGIAQTALSLTELEYLYTSIAFSDKLAEMGGAVLHGSAVAYNDQGIIFSANSGTGKSTHTNLWKQRFGNKIIIVNDDKPAIRYYDKIPYIFGTPWSGKSDLNVNVQVQLKTVVFIKRAKTNRVERLNARASIFSLMSQISRPYYDEKIGLKTMDVIKKLVLSVPIYRLHCNPDLEAVDTIHQHLIQEGVIDK
ncbi:MAG: hypothetical protein ABRQ26_12950 [Syntrophomonadaceae bacterium]